MIIFREANPEAQSAFLSHHSLRGNTEVLSSSSLAPVPISGAGTKDGSCGLLKGNWGNVSSSS